MGGIPEYEQDDDITRPFKIKGPDGTYETGIVPETGERVVLIRKLTPRQVRMFRAWGNELEPVEPEDKGGIWKSQPTKDKDLDSDD